jgi:hypothetical protein
MSFSRLAPPGELAEADRRDWAEEADPATTGKKNGMSGRWSS